MKRKTSITDIFGNLRFNIDPQKELKNYKPITNEIQGQGGYGIVIRVNDYSNSNDEFQEPVIRAMKLLKPEHSKNLKVFKDFFKEIHTLSKLNHPNVTRIFDWGYAECTLTTKSTKTTKVPYYVMECIEGVDLQKIIDKENSLNQRFFEELVSQTLSAISVCQQDPDKIIHLDIKPDNILVVEKGDEIRFVLTDFGKAKLVENIYKPGKDYETPGGGIFKYVHPMLRPYLKKNKVPIENFRKYAEQFDLYSIGKVFRDTYKKVEEFKILDRTLNPWNYFINDLCWYHDEDQEEHYPPRLLDFRTADEALNATTRIREKHALNEFHYQMRYSDKGIPLIRLSKNESIPFPIEISNLVDTQEFQRLRSIYQLGVTELVYPGATHTRFIHSLGSYYRCLFYISSLRRTSLFNYLYDNQIIENLLIASLLHDIGHYPFAHYFEEMEVPKRLKVKHEYYSEKIINGKLLLEELIDREYTSSQFRDRRKSQFVRKIKEKPSLHKVLSDHADIKKIKEIYKGGGLLEPLKNIVSGPIDCDKLDYLIRDSNFCGVKFADTIDLSRFYFSLILNIEHLPEINLGITSKGKSSIESIISARYNLFSEVYWHKTCRSATAMIKDAFWYARINFTQHEFEWAIMLLGDEDFLHWLNEKIANDEIGYDLIGGLNVYNARNIYKRFRTYSKGWKEEVKLKSYDDFTGLGNNFIKNHQYKRKLVKILNRIGKTRRGWENLKHHHIIIDIPNVTQDRYHHITVKYPPSVKGKIFYDMKDISALSKVLYDSFADEAKKVRLFCHPKYFKQILDLGNDVDVAISTAFDN